MSQTKTHTFLFLILLGLLLVSKAISLVGFSFEYTGNDDLIFWQMAKDYSQGIFHEPFMYGQNYNYGIESLFSVPLQLLGVPLRYALPITTAWMGIFPFVVFAFGLFKKKHITSAYLFLLIPVLMPIEYDIITTITRGFINGLFFVSFLIFPVLSPFKSRSFLVFGLFSSLAVVTNPNSALIVLPIGLYLFFFNWNSVLFYVFTFLALIPVFVGYFFSKYFYEIHPDFVVHQLPELTYSFTRVWETLQQMDRSFAYLTPIFFGGNWLVLLFLFFGSIFLIKKDWRMGFSLLIGVIFILFSLGINKVEEGVGVIFFSPTRMFLALPLLLAFTFSWIFKGKISYWANLIFVFISILFVGLKFLWIEDTVSDHTFKRSYGPVAIENIEVLTSQCEGFNSVIQRKKVDLVVFTLSSKKNVPEISFYNFGCELLVPDFPESTMLHKERRTWLYTKHKSKIIGSMLFLNYEFNEELIKSSGLEYEIISEIPDALLIQNNEYTLPEICELFELRYKRDSN